MTAIMDTKKAEKESDIREDGSFRGRPRAGARP